MAALSFEEARNCVLDRVQPLNTRVEEVALEDADGRVLAEELHADRDCPALARSIRDGFAVRAADLPGRLKVLGEVRAGEVFSGSVGPGEAVEIMTGAPLPPGADAVLMVEHVARGDGQIAFGEPVKAGQFVNPQGSEARAGETLLEPGRPIDFTTIALLAMLGRERVRVYERPRIAILSTGDEVVEIHETPRPHQVRNSNAWSLAAQVRRAGGRPGILPVARDTAEHTRSSIEPALAHDLLLLSGGVSAGKYDVVEPVLAQLGAEFYFDRVRIQPGQPLVFGRVRGVPFFGLPGNPASTMVTFELFARAALERLAGLAEPELPILLARLTAEFRHKTGLTRFLPARLSADGTEVTPWKWQGSSDIPSLARANAFLVAEERRERWAAGDLIGVLRK